MKTNIRAIGDILNGFHPDVNVYRFEKGNQKEEEYITFQEQIQGIHFSDNKVYDIVYNIEFTYYCKTQKDYRNIDFMNYAIRELELLSIEMEIDTNKNTVVINGVTKI